MITSKIVGKSKQEINNHIANVKSEVIVKEKEKEIILTSVDCQNIFDNQIENQKKLLK